MTVETNVQYETRTQQTLRGTEAKSIAKWQADGWELVSQTPGKIRTQLVFRRPKPKPPWRMYAILGGVMVVLATIIAVNAALGGGDKADPAPSPSAIVQSDDETTTDEPSSDQTAEPEVQSSETPSKDIPLTPESSPELAALLTGTDFGPTIEAFAQKYAGQVIEFDGSIWAMNNHAGYKTRYDIMVLSGDFNETASSGGPTFQFRDVNVTNDLNLTGDVPDTIGVRTNLHVIARVGEFDSNTGLFQLKPVETRVR